jgi:galactokinase
MMFATHKGLSTQYEVSCKELDFLVSYVKNHPGVLGARMMGGGFGGCTINLVKQQVVNELIGNIYEAYQKQTGLTLSVYQVRIEDGSSCVQKDPVYQSC